MMPGQSNTESCFRRTIFQGDNLMTKCVEFCKMNSILTVIFILEIDGCMLMCVVYADHSLFYIALVTHIFISIFFQRGTYFVSVFTVQSTCLDEVWRQTRMSERCC